MVRKGANLHQHKGGFLGIYQDDILRRLINLAMRNCQLVPYRERVIASAQGRVLEVGLGSGEAAGR